MSYIENYIKLKKTIDQNQQDTHKLYNTFAKSNGELNVALSLNPQLNATELKFLKMAVDALQDATSLICNLRTETHNKNNLIMGLDKTFGESLEFMKEQDSQIKVAKAPAIKGGRRSPKYEPYEEIILSVMKEYISTENQLRPKQEKLTQSRAITKIENQINNGDGIEESTFNNWLKLFKKNNALKIFN